MASDAASFDISSGTLGACLSEINACLQSVLDPSHQAEEGASMVNQRVGLDVQSPGCS